MTDWLETIMQHCEERFADRVQWVRTAERDHGAWAGVAIKTTEGWRHAVAVEPETTPEQAFARLAKWLEVKLGAA